MIPHPISLKGVQKRVRGMHGRNGSSGISDFKTWKAFEEEIEYIWHNAWHYNEDGSEISNLAKDLEVTLIRSTILLGILTRYCRSSSIKS